MPIRGGYESSGKCGVRNRTIEGKSDPLYHRGFYGMKKIIIARGVMHAIGGRDTLIGRGNINVSIARTSEEILNLHGVHRADVIITELLLPLMDGVKLCSAIRGNEELKHVSIIMVCANTEAALAQCRKAQANVIITQPVDPVQLFSKVSELLMVPRRQDLRAVLNVSVNGQTGRRSFLGMSENISISGILLETDQTLKKGDQVACGIDIAGRTITAEGIVMRVEKRESCKFRYGIKFRALDTKSLVLIDQFVRGGIKQ
jgi:CheY-like chemotaxis protein